jgi:hypothetical protein
MWTSVLSALGNYTRLLQETAEVMACKSCGSDNQQELGSEINIHFPGGEGLDKPAVLAFPKLLVCLHCGFTEFTLPEGELHRLAKDAAA